MVDNQDIPGGKNGTDVLSGILHLTGDDRLWETVDTSDLVPNIFKFRILPHLVTENSKLKKILWKENCLLSKNIQIF